MPFRCGGLASGMWTRFWRFAKETGCFINTIRRWRESILADMTALPPGKGMEDKAYVGFFEGEKLVAVLDWISGYPAKETAWIGLFMVSAEKQGKGVGSGIIRDMAASLKAVGYREIQLGVDKGNPQSFAFWTKNGFEVLREDGYIVMGREI